MDTIFYAVFRDAAPRCSGSRRRLRSCFGGRHCRLPGNYHAGRHACLYSSARVGFRIWRARGVGVTLGAVSERVGVAVGACVGVGLDATAHHRIGVSLAVVHTRADDDAVSLMPSRTREVFIGQIPARPGGMRSQGDTCLFRHKEMESRKRRIVSHHPTG